MQWHQPKTKILLYVEKKILQQWSQAGVHIWNILVFFLWIAQVYNTDATLSII